jgi:hypothetical protein
MDLTAQQDTDIRDVYLDSLLIQIETGISYLHRIKEQF